MTDFLRKYLPLRAPEGAAGGAADGGGGGAAAAPWHTGVEAETLGFWQNKGYDLTDPVKLASGMTKSYRELEKHFGTPANEILRMPKADAKPEDVAAFWQRLGTPKEAKDYDFSGVKNAAGEPIPAPLADAIRTAALTAHLPKDAASSIAAAVQKHIDEAATATATVNAGKLAEEKAALAKNWGPKADFNKLTAMEGARRLGITPEAVAALEGQIGYAAVMEAMRKIGAGTSEDTFVDRGQGGGGNPTTLEGARARLTELEGDKEWSKRLRAGDATAKAEWRALTEQISAAA